MNAFMCVIKEHHHLVVQYCEITSLWELLNLTVDVFLLSNKMTSELIWVTSPCSLVSNKSYDAQSELCDPYLVYIFATIFLREKHFSLRSVPPNCLVFWGTTLDNVPTSSDHVITSDFRWIAIVVKHNWRLTDNWTNPLLAYTLFEACVQLN